MKNSHDIQHGLMHYFASVGSTAGRIFGIRDFNTQVMMDAYTAEERDRLQPALEALIAAGILCRVSPTDYSLTAEGVRLVRTKTSQGEPWCVGATENPACT